MRSVTVVTSPDGVPLQVDERGAGPAIVLVHGSTSSGADWVPLRRELQGRFRVVTYDRRGRGGSGDGRTYSFEAERDDLRAVLAHVGEPAHLVGHSFGARVALEVAADRDDLRSLTLYEPPLEAAALGAIHARVRARHLAQDWDGLVAGFLSDAGVPPDELSDLRAAPRVWNRFLDAAPRAERELGALAARPVDLDAAARVSAPTQLLLGGLTDAAVYVGPRDELVRRLRATVHVLPGQRHTAMVGDPVGFAAAVRQLTG